MQRHETGCNAGIPRVIVPYDASASHNMADVVRSVRFFTYNWYAAVGLRGFVVGETTMLGMSAGEMVGGAAITGNATPAFDDVTLDAEADAETIAIGETIVFGKELLAATTARATFRGPAAAVGIARGEAASVAKSFGLL